MTLLSCFPCIVHPSLWFIFQIESKQHLLLENGFCWTRQTQINWALKAEGQKERGRVCDTKSEQMPSGYSWSAIGIGHLIIKKCIYLFDFDKLSTVTGLGSANSPGHCEAVLPYQRTRSKTHMGVGGGWHSWLRPPTQQTTYVCPRKINTSASRSLYDILFLKEKKITV